jgi:hypothetical protein
MRTPSKVFRTGKLYKTRNGTLIKYVAGQRYIFNKFTNEWQLSKYQDRNRNLPEVSDRGL